MHNDNYTIWTSWYIAENTAKHFAKGPNGDSEGVVLSRRFKKSLVVPVHPDFKGLAEEEYLVPGIVLGANVDNIPGLPKDNSANDKK